MPTSSPAAERGTARFAPSATGRAHPGTLLAGLLCWLDARAGAARLVLRLEDLDPQRCTAALTQGLIEDLTWFGLDWDVLEVQSAHGGRHAAALDALERQGLLYPCSLSRSQLTAIGRRGPDGAFLPDGRDRDRPLPVGGWRACGEPVRLRLPDHLGDPVVRRRDGAVAYQLAVVVDDGAVGVTRVVRGRDLEASTPTQNAIRDLLGLPIPSYHHHLLLLERGEDRKLSKFHGAVAVPALRQQMDAPTLCGRLATLAGLIATPHAVTPQDLLGAFSWERVRGEDVVW